MERRRPRLAGCQQRLVKTPNVDVVLVIDTSSSMAPCIEQLKAHLRDLVRPMQGHVARVRFGVVALSASSAGGENLTYRVESLAGDWRATNAALYGPATQVTLLTEDSGKVLAFLDSLRVTGDEDNLLALDFALDYPFGPVADTKRVVALFSDEILENGVVGGAPLDSLPKIIEKLHARRIKLFCAVPFSDAAQQLGEANGAEIEAVQGDAGLSSVDFSALLGQMGKSISVASLQGALEERYSRALFRQDAWVEGAIPWSDSDRT